MPNNRISALRHEHGMNQKELGEKLGVGQTTVSAWEKGKNEPDHKTLYKMKQLFNCSIGYLMGYEDDETTRGLTQEEISKRKERERLEKEIVDARKLDSLDYPLTPEEEAELLEDAEQEAYREWLITHPNCYYEAYKINQMCDQFNAPQRKFLLEIAKNFAQGIASTTE